MKTFNYFPVQLTIDLKLNLPRQAARIQQFKGSVFAKTSQRWLVYGCPIVIHLVAMARAFGDFCLKDFGLISVLDIFYHSVTKKDEFVLFKKQKQKKRRVCDSCN